MTRHGVNSARASDSFEYGRVLVDFDGSPSSVRAVEWAECEAEARGAALEIVDDRHQLLTEAHQADLMVMSVDDTGAGRAALHGSIAHAASRRSPCPVVVVRGLWSRTTHKIIVATDTSSASHAGIVLAVREAGCHHADLMVVHVREPHTNRAEAQAIAALAANECRDLGANPVRELVCEGNPTDALVSASGDADLLVVGSRGRSGFKTLLFGSVAENLVDRAACPVLVTHPRPHA